MHQITIEDLLKKLEERRGTSIVVIVNAFIMDTVYCIDDLDFTIKEEKKKKELRIFSKNGQKEYYDYHGIYVDLESINKVSQAANTIYVYIGDQLIKIKF